MPVNASGTIAVGVLGSLARRHDVVHQLMAEECLKQKPWKKSLNVGLRMESSHALDSASARALGVAKHGGYCRA